eukprot:COSAG06_NODE_4624_length_4091_cov_2.704409_2_plen_158_part_00
MRKTEKKEPVSESVCLWLSHVRSRLGFYQDKLSRFVLCSHVSVYLRDVRVHVCACVRLGMSGSNRARRVKEIIAEKAQKKQQAKEAAEAAMSKARMPPPPPPSSSSSSPQPPPRPRSPLQQQHGADSHHPPARLGSGLPQDGDRCGNISFCSVFLSF